VYLQCKITHPPSIYLHGTTILYESFTCSLITSKDSTFNSCELSYRQAMNAYQLLAADALEAGCTDIADVECEQKNSQGLYGALKSIP
jgi:hypothetical protein